MLPWLKFTRLYYCCTRCCAVSQPAAVSCYRHVAKLCVWFAEDEFPVQSHAKARRTRARQELSLPFFLVVECKSPRWILSGHWFSQGVSDFGICFKSCLPEPTTWQNADYLVTASFKSEWCMSLHQSHFAPETFLFVPRDRKSVV